MGLGPRLDAFEISPNFGLGDILQAPPPPLSHPIAETSHAPDSFPPPPLCLNCLMQLLSDLTLQCLMNLHSFYMNNDLYANLASPWLTSQILVPNHNLYPSPVRKFPPQQRYLNQRTYRKCEQCLIFEEQYPGFRQR